MPSLEQVQSAMMQTLELGPAYLLEGLFAAGRERALLGMKVHANTISHARLVALEDTFPRTRTLLGREAFNALSRRYLDWPGVAAHALMDIGRDFAAFLAAAGEARAAVDLATFEWLWLDAYHAAEASALALAELAGIDEQALLAAVLMRHPAARLLHADRSVHSIIGEDVPGLGDAHAILLTRPQAQVLVSPATSLMSAILARAGKPASICNLLESGSEHWGMDRPLPEEGMIALVALLGAGALERVG